MVGVHFQCGLSPLLPVAVFVSSDVHVVWLPGFVRAPSFYIDKTVVALSDTFGALYLEVEATGAR